MQCGNGKKSKNKINRERDISLSLKFLSMKHIKLFENIDLFQNWKDSEEYVTPNVTYITEDNSIIYDPYKNENVICVYNITKSGKTSICDTTDNISSIIVDGIVIDPVKKYDFKEAGEHTVEFVLIDKTLIGDYTFYYYCTSLKSVTIPDSVTSIGSAAFSNCTSLKSINIPDSVTSIGSSAFSQCYSLTSINIPESVTSIGSDAFYRCTGLTFITIPNSVTSISEGVFTSCSSLTSINIPNSVTSIGNNVFSNCSSLTSINIPNSITSIGNYVFSNCSALKSITIPDSVTSIGYNAFEGCSSLTSINIPESVTSIGNNAFNSCSKLSEIICLGTEPITFGSDKNVFKNLPSNGVLRVPTGSNTGLENELPEGWTVEYI